MVLEVALMVFLCLLGVGRVLMTLLRGAVLLLATALVAIVTASSLLVGVLILLTLSLLLRLEATLLLGSLVQGRGEFLQ